MQDELKVMQFFYQYGLQIVQQYVNLIMKTPARQVIDCYIDSVIDICRAYRGEAQQLDAVKVWPPNSSLVWLEQVLSTLPSTVFTSDEVQRLSSKFHSSENLQYLGSELNIIYKRAKNHNTRS